MPCLPLYGMLVFCPQPKNQAERGEQDGRDIKPAISIECSHNIGDSQGNTGNTGGRIGSTGGQCADPADQRRFRLGGNHDRAEAWQERLQAKVPWHQLSGAGAQALSNCVGPIRSGDWQREGAVTGKL